MHPGVLIIVVLVCFSSHVLSGGGNGGGGNQNEEPVLFPCLLELTDFLMEDGTSMHEWGCYSYSATSPLPHYIIEPHGRMKTYFEENLDFLVQGSSFVYLDEKKAWDSVVRLTYGAEEVECL